MKRLISIIIPVYNVETYLSECIESVLKQTYQNIEILLIDDGSPDNSGKICNEYAKKDSRVRVIHKENGGVSSARNVGLKQANGEYITFVDGDDFIAESYIEELYKTLENVNADLSFCKYNHYNGLGFQEIYENFPADLLVERTSEAFIDFFCRFFTNKNNFFGSIWRVLYKKSVLQDLSFNENVKISEDLLFLLQAIFNAKKLCFVEKTLYHYRVTQGSACRSYKKDYVKSQEELYNGLKYIFNQIENQKTIKLFNTYSALLCYYLFSNEIKYREKEWKHNIQEIRDCKLYEYFKLKNGLKIQTVKSQIKFLIVWVLVKWRLV